MDERDYQLNPDNGRDPWDRDSYETGSTRPPKSNRGLLALILVAVGSANMWLAIFADVGVMVLAVLNAIRALFVKKL